MRNGVVNVQQYSSTTSVQAKSPYIWAPSQGIDLRDLSLGYSIDTHFDASLWPSVLTFQDAGSTAVSGVTYDTSVTLSTATLPSGNDHIMLGVPGSTAALAGRIGFVTRPLKNLGGGGTYLIFEAALTVVNAGAQQGMFVGLTTSTGLTSATTILKTVSATAASNALAASTGAIGFYMHGDTPNNFDAVFQNQFGTGTISTSTSATGVQVVLANVLTASTYGGDPGNVYQQPASAPGVLTSTTLVKLGIIYQQPLNQIWYTVNGAQVAAVNVTPALFDVINDYGACVVYGATNGATVSTGVKIDFIAAAAQVTKS